MAKQVITRLVDDLDGGEAEETVRFTFDGIAYEIDLSGRNAAQFRKLMDPYQLAGTKVGRVGAGAQLIPTRPTKVALSQPTDRELNQRIRAWAEKSGYQVNERGRIAQHIVDSFHAANGQLPDTSAKAVQRALSVDTVHSVVTEEPAPARSAGRKGATTRTAPVAAFRSAKK